jgi:Zn-dependent metalloprotease
MNSAPLARSVRPRLLPLVLGLTLPLGGVLFGQGAPTVAPGVRQTLSASGQLAVAWGDRIEDMSRAGRLRLRSSVADTMIEGRVHDRFDQYAGEARIFGAQIVRQRSASGVETVFGDLYPDDLGMATVPRLSADAASTRIVEIVGRAPIGRRAPELVVLPIDDGSFRLTWFTHVLVKGDALAVFVDAQTGDEVLRYSDLHRQSAVGTGTGVLGDRKKLATRQVSSGFLADDTLRPPSLITYDLKGAYFRAIAILDGDFPAAQSDIASDTDNVWTDGAVVDAHAYIGYTYDYYFQRFGRRGLDNNNRPIRGLVHPARPSDALSIFGDIEVFFDNAGWCSACGSDEQGYMYFGVGIPEGYVLPDTGQRVANLAGSFDVVAHELSHAVTTYSSNLIYRNESGALNEAFSDIMAVGAEFYVSSSGRSTRPPDYVMGEDVFTVGNRGSKDGIRSLSNPADFDQPDHYSRRFLGASDNGGVHINSGIANHAFYLAIEGGTNRTSGLVVQGVGGANREQIEKVFYRGFTAFLTPSATFAQARQATLRAASELYGDTSPAFRAVSQAWTAVGVS